MIFTHMIVLKKSPFYIYCEKESEAVDQAKRFKPEEVVGVVVALGGLQLMEVQETVSLTPVSVKEVPLMVRVDENTFEELPEDAEINPLSEEELDEIIDPPVT